MDDGLVKCLELVKSFGGVRAVEGVNLSLHAGVFSLLIGPNGSGKSTLINLIAGYYYPDSGKILMHGKDITRLKPHERFSIGLVRTFQTARLFTSLTVLDNLLLAAGATEGENIRIAPFRRKWLVREMEMVEKAYQILELVGLEKLRDQPAGKLSGGQMKLLELGRVVMSGARVILMDEPTAGLNPVIAESVLSHIRRLVTELGLATLLVEHRLDLAMKYADKVFAMFNGRLIGEGSPEEVLTIPDVVESYLGERLA
ncbi:MAG: ABC transporter ATP-binding protein [Nitrososphaerota archaeon]